MGHKISVVKSVDKITPLGWNRSYSESVKLPDETGGKQIFLSISAADEYEGGIDQIPTDSEISDLLHESFLEKGSSVEKSLQRIVDYLVGKTNSDNESANICLILISESKAYFRIHGEVFIYIFRNQKFSSIKTKKGESIFVAGEVLENDLICVFSGKDLQKNAVRDIFAFYKTGKNIFPADIQKILSFEPSATGFLVLQILKEIERKSGGFVVNDGMSSQKVTTETSDKSGETLTSKNRFEASILQKLQGFVSKQKLYVQSEDYMKNKKARRYAAFVGAVLLCVLLLSMWFGLKQKHENDFRNSYQEELSLAEDGLKESLNLILVSPERSREIFLESKARVEKLVGQGVQDEKLQRLTEEISKNHGRILGEYQENAQLFVDMGLLTDNFNGNKIFTSQSQVYIADSASRKIIKLSMPNKRSEVIVGPNKVDEISDSAAYAGKVFVVNLDGIYEVSGEPKKIIDGDFPKNVLLSAFAGNLYLLNVNDSTIKRFAGDGSSFGSGKDWISAEVSVSLSNSKQMVIDGSVWVLKIDGQIMKFVQGNKQNFSMFPNLSSQQVDSIFTSDEDNNLYILDKENKSVHVYDKAGKFVARYLNEEIGNATSLIVSEKEKILLLLVANKVYSINLKHLD